MLAPALVDVGGGWPFVLAIAAALGAAGFRESRRRTALNEALHEVRRPLQVLALTAPVAGAPAGELEGPVRMAAAALERLDREINGGANVGVHAAVEARPLLEAAVARWQARAALAGRSLELRCGCGQATVNGDPAELARALDNLVANAIEHGGRRVVVTAGARARRLRVVVRDSGRGAHRPGGQRARAGLTRRISGGARHGHGLRIVRRIAAEHGGYFALRAGAGATEAVLELPLERTEARQ